MVVVHAMITALAAQIGRLWFYCADLSVSSPSHHPITGTLNMQCLDNVYCTGSESSLLSCSRGYSIGVHNCRPGNEAGVKCPSKCAVPLCTESTFHGVST